MQTSPLAAQAAPGTGASRWPVGSGSAAIRPPRSGGRRTSATSSTPRRWCSWSPPLSLPQPHLPLTLPRRARLLGRRPAVRAPARPRAARGRRQPGPTGALDVQAESRARHQDGNYGVGVSTPDGWARRESKDLFHPSFSDLHRCWRLLVPLRLTKVLVQQSLLCWERHTWWFSVLSWRWCSTRLRSRSTASSGPTSPRCPWCMALLEGPTVGLLF